MSCAIIIDCATEYAKPGSIKIEPPSPKTKDVLDVALYKSPATPDDPLEPDDPAAPF
jgi:hypothetical protein